MVYQIPMQNRNFYTILGVASDSEDVVIAAAYKALMRKYHPDTNTDQHATEKAKEINYAYATLSNPIKRAEYDRLHGSASKDQTDKNTRKEYQKSKSSPSKGDDPDEKINPNKGVELENSQNHGFRHIQIVGLVLGVAVVFAFFSGAFDNSSGDYSSDTESAYSFDDTAIDTAAGAVDAAAAAAAAANSGPTIGSTDTSLDTLNFDEIELPKKLGQQTTLSFQDIEKAVNELDRVVSRSGISGAKKYSEKCHEVAKSEMEWSKFDFCVAFDLSASYLDNAISQSEDVQRNPYFSFMEENAVNQYVGAQFMTYTLNQRVNAIKRAVRPTLLEKVSQKVSMQENKVEGQSNSSSISTE